MTTLRFMGDLPLWAGAALAIIVAIAVWRLYRRERSGWLLAMLRAAAVALVLLMLTGPVLVHRYQRALRAQVNVFLDSSMSMGLTDKQMTEARKLLLASEHGWLNKSKLQTAMYEAAEDLAEARRATQPLRRLNQPTADRLTACVAQFNDAIGKAADRLADVDGDVLPTPPAPNERWNRLKILSVKTDAGAESQHLDDGSVLMSGALPEKDNYTIVAAPDLWRITGVRIDAIPDRSLPHQAAGRNPDNGNFIITHMSVALIDPAGNITPIKLTDAAADYTQGDMDVAAMLNDDRNRGWGTNDRQKDPHFAVVKFDAPIDVVPDAKLQVKLEHQCQWNHHMIGRFALSATGMSDPIASVKPDRKKTDTEADKPVPAATLMAELAARLQKPAAALADLSLSDEDEDLARRTDTNRRLAILETEAAYFESWLRDSFESYCRGLVASNDDTYKKAIEQFDQTTRWQRVTDSLTGEGAVLSKLAESHDVQLVELGPGEPQVRWTSVDPKDLDALKKDQPTSSVSDLTTGVKTRLGGETGDKQVAEQKRSGDDAAPTVAVIISDGQHNRGPSPVALAQSLGARDVGVYTVLAGSPKPAEDLSVLDIEAPESVYHEDRMRGRVVLNDTMPVDREFTIRIQHGDDTLWERKLRTTGAGQRAIDYDLSIRDAVAKEKGDADKNKKVEVDSLPMTLRVKIDAIPDETRTDNNQAPVSLRAIIQRPRVLVIDGRPRWETRYIASMFERDERWQLNLVYADPTEGEPRNWIKRGSGKGEFPKDRASLLAYDLIVLGEVQPNVLSDEEVTWLRDFVAQRAGGLIMVDGRRGYLRAMGQTALEPLMPVTWASADGMRATSLRLTETGEHMAALVLAEKTEENVERWRQLPPPHWVAPAKLKPGAEALAEAVVSQRRSSKDPDAASPVIAVRRFGAGKVFYIGMDETWRWRYHVEDRDHRRFWNQVSGWVIEQPFAVSDQFVRLGVDNTTYAPGDSAQVRVRLSDAEGRPVPAATVMAVLWRDGQRVGDVALDADQNAAGLFEGRTAALEPGKYEVTVSVTGQPDDQMQAKTAFYVAPPEVGELAKLSADAELMRQVADAAQGRYLREEQMDRLPQMMAPLNRTRTIETQTALAQSYLWFLPVIGLLSLEWVIRQRRGLM